MELQGRNLQLGIEGEDVVLLQQELRLLRFTIDDRKGYFGRDTRDAVMQFQQQHGLDATGEVDEHTASFINEALYKEQFIVRGQVRLENGIPFRDGIVRAFHQGFRTEETKLGEAIPNPEGNYEIAYPAASLLQNLGRERANLFVRAYHQDNEKPIATSEESILFNAEPEATIDLVIDTKKYRGAPEYNRLRDDIEQVIPVDNLINLSETEIPYLAAEANLDRSQVDLAVQAVQRSAETGLPPEIFYGLAHQNIPISSRSTILRQDKRIIQNALETALTENIIPHEKPEATIVEETLNQLHELAIDEQLADNLGDLLKTSPTLDLRKQRVFVSEYLNYEGSDEAEFWEKLKERPELEDEGIRAELKFTLTVGAIAQNYAPLAQKLRETVQNQEDLENREEVPNNLATWSLEKWEEVVKEAGFPEDTPGENEEEKAKGFAETVFRNIEARFPTSVILHKLRHEVEEIPDKQILLEYLEENPKFELTTAKISEVIESENLEDQKKIGVSSWMRTSRLAPERDRYKVIRELKKANLDSAIAIASIGQAGFIEQYAQPLGKKVAEEVWNKASHVNAMALTVYMDLRELFSGPTPRAILDTSKLYHTPKEIVTLRNLFGSLDFCECEHCQSVYSPAAYFVDLLQFLKNATKNGKHNPLSVLLNRRPDLTEIELSCENTNTLVPYVDLVNEVLENAVGRESLPSEIYNDLVYNPDIGLLREVLRALDIEQLSYEANLTVLKTRYIWRITDGTQKYLILRENDKLNFYKLSTQSRATGANQNELSAYPEYLNKQAYIKLAQATYPFSLPFDLWFEEAQIYMQHLGMKRYQWIEELPELGIQNVPKKEIRVACDHLGIIELERQLITGKPNNKSESELWGLQAGETVDVLCKLKRPHKDTGKDLGGLLKQGGFNSKIPGENYRAIRQLVHTQFINPQGKLTVEFKGDPCDLEKAELKHKDAQTKWEDIFKKMRRFLRLQRKLGWTIPELDKAIAAFPEKKLDDKLLQRLSNIERLREKLKVPLLEMLSWSGTIDTAEDRAEEEKSKKTPSLYEQVFLNKSVDNPDNPLFELNDTKTELQKVDNLPPDKDIKITEHTTTIVGALGITVDDLMRLVKGDRHNRKLVDDILNLKHLSALYRIVSFSKALKLKIREFISAQVLLGFNPFEDTKNAEGDIERDRTTNTLKFIEQVQKIQASKFTIPELDYLLRHQYEEATDLFVPTDGEIAQAIGQLKRDLSKISAETEVVPDPEGKLTLEKLTQFLEPDDAQKLVDWVKNSRTTTYSTQLDKLPDQIEFPEDIPQDLTDLRKKVRYVEDAKELRIDGILTQAERDILLNIDATNQTETYKNYQKAIKKIHGKSIDFLAQAAIKKQLETILGLADALVNILDRFSQVSDRLPRILQHISIYLQQKSAIEQQLSTALELDADITNLLLEKLVEGQYNSSKTALDDFLALLTIDLSLEKFDSNKQIRRRGMVQAEQSGTYSFFIKPSGQEEWGDDENKPNEKMWVNERVINKNNQTIELETGQFYDYQLEYAANTNPKPIFCWITPSSRQKQPIPAEKLIPSFVIHSYRLLHKLALFINKFKIRADELNYLAKHSSNQYFYNFKTNQFPLEPKADTALFKQWLHLYSIFTFRDRFSQAKTRLIDVFAAAYQSTNDKENVEAAQEQLLALTNWNQDDLETLSGSKGFSLTKDDFRQGNKFDKLLKAFTVIRQLGISAQQLINWTNNVHLGVAFKNLTDPNFKKKEGMVQSLKQVVKAKYGQERWLKVAKPLRDELRKKQRSALAAYLIHEYGLENNNDLYAKFLIDVEMDPCMMTSRIKQAISSVQLFVQRCLMNLEAEVSLSPEIANEWKWRKNYRVWEANRKVFLYPENWIEPELRDNKSPFFEELENELLQNEITNDTVEQAFLNYLEKLNDVARLEIVGMYEQKDKWYEWQEKRTVNKVLHVFGRTQNTPNVYYYRRWIDETYWTPWEKVDVDIEGDHLIPVVWNRRLYLFWPLFRKTEDPANTKTNKIEIYIAWSEYKNGRWISKKVTSDFSEYKEYSGTSFPFNESDVTFKAHHTDDGKLKILIYKPDLTVELKSNTTYKAFAQFIFDGCQGDISNNTIDSVDSLNLPSRSEVHYMTFKEKEENASSGSDSFEIPSINSSINLKDKQRILDKTPSIYCILYPHQYLQFKAGKRFFYQDQRMTFFATPVAIRRSFSSSLGYESKIIYLFQSFYHHFVCNFVQALNRYGVDGLLNPSANNKLFRQQGKNELFFKEEYLDLSTSDHSRAITTPYPLEDIDFSDEGTYSNYNWELFFHTPLLVADKLSKNQRFEEAMKWFHYIFDPTLSSDEPYPARFWKVRPFYEVYREDNSVPKRIQDLMLLLNKGDPELEKQVKEWEKNPFKPHLIARHRLPAYMKTVVMKYIENLLAWADQLFRRDSIESINEATQLYILAAEILGLRPEQIPARKRRDFTYSDLEQRKIDPFSNVLLKIQDLVLSSGQITNSNKKIQQQQAPTLDILYFGIPHNDKLLKYWDTVEDRLFKIRHCMNIEGRVRQLPLFQPPIDPALLVRAAAAGIDLSSVLNDLYAPLPHYRFSYMLQKALELCADVKALGSSLLSALEKKDAEKLSLIRASQEKSLLKLVRTIKKQQVEESITSREALEETKETTNIRYSFYRDIPLTIPQEASHLNELRIAQNSTQNAQREELTGSSLTKDKPDVSVGWSGGMGGGPYATLSLGRQNLIAHYQHKAREKQFDSSAHSYKANLASILASRFRRKNDWGLQRDLAEQELKQIDKQIEAANIREAITQNELENHDKQIENASAIQDFLKGKYTNEELYSWMLGQISATFFQSYQLAYDIAKRAEKAYRYELGLEDSDFIQFGYWDSLKKGLLAGEKLHYDLKRMEMAYLEQNKREYELTKHISLAVLDPVTLLQLKENGECFVNIPEAIFDLDYPGHYLRRIKSISLTIPCVTGSYTNVSCTLTLLRHSVRNEPNLDDPLKDTFGAIQSIATSNAQNDSGLFELNFRDERYLPFEGAGVISEWRLELPKEFRQFDYNTISDVVIHMRYTAREGGAILKNKVVEALQQALEEMALGENGKERTGLFQVFSAKHEFPSEWHQFLYQFQNLSKDELPQILKSRNELSQILKLDLQQKKFPFLFRDKTILITSIEIYIKLKEEEEIKYEDNEPLCFALKNPSGNKPYTIQPDNNSYLKFKIGGSPIKTLIYANPVKDKKERVGSWSLEIPVVTKSAESDGTLTYHIPDYLKDPEHSIILNPKVLEDIFIVCHYTVSK